MTSNLVSYGADFTVRSKIVHSECANSGCIMVWKAIVTVETGRAGIKGNYINEGHRTRLG